jgi:transposase-like protein
VYSSDSFKANTPQRRRRYDPQFKAELIAHCQQRGVSVAAIARDHGINANLLRRWIQEHERYGDPEASVTTTPVTRDIAAQFIALPTSISKPAASEQQDCPTQIEIKLERGELKAAVQWPLSHSEQCAAWLREVMR